MRWLVRIIHSHFSAGQTSLSLRFQCSPEEQVLLEMAWASDRLSAWGAPSSARWPPFLLQPFWLLGLQPLFTERPPGADRATQDTDPEGPRPPPQSWSPRPAPCSAHPTWGVRASVSGLRKVPVLVWGSRLGGTADLGSDMVSRSASFSSPSFRLWAVHMHLPD